MEVRLTLQPFAQENVDIDLQYVLQTLKNKNIVFGIKEDIIKAAIGEVRKDNVSVINALAAEGERPINGDDGKIEFLFKTDKKIRPVDKDGEHLDFHNVSAIENVKKDQPLARLVPPTLGSPGKDVFGQKVEPRAGAKRELPVWSGTKVSNQDKNLLVSCIDGNVSYDGEVAAVSADYTVEKDVDFSVGNISYSGSVIIKGDVKSGFSINAGGNIEIGGTVGDAAIKSDSNVKIIGGLVGSGEGQIEAKGDVVIGFARNQMIIANNVEFLREAVDCTIYAKGTVTAKGGRLSIIGGIIIAGSLIEVDVLGSRIEAPTEVEVGVDYTVVKGLMKVKREIHSLTTVLENIDHDINTLKKTKESKGILVPKLQDTLDKFLKQKEDLTSKLNDLSSREKIASKRLNVNKDAKVMVHHIIYPGVTIKIGDAVYTVQDELKNVAFYLVGNEIKTAPN